MQILRFPFTSFETAPLPAVPVELEKPANTDEAPFVDLPIQVVLTQEEIDAREAAAKVAGYEEGFAKGLEQGKGEAAEREQQLSGLLQQTNIAIASVQNMYQEAADEFRRATLELSGAIALKLAGRALKEKPDEAVLQMLEGLIPNLIDHPSLIIEVHPDLADHLQEKIISLSSSQGFAGTLKVLASADVAPGDCVVKWEQGEAVLNQAALQQKVKDLLGI